ncbi:MAG: hypothetical protein KF782_18770 [Labilithrix sp.]|nr:hypothetical protein [Labilithrix sp.]
MLGGRRGVRGMVAFGLFAVACGTTYGDGGAGDASAPGEDEDAGAGRADASPDVELPAAEDAAAEDAAADGPPAFSEPCPACPADARCVASGCEGDATTSTCSKPVDLVDPIAGELIAFVCPEGSRIDLPQACVPGGGKTGLNVAVLRLNASPSTSWRVRVTGSNAFVATGACAQPTTCAGGTNGSDANVAGLATVMIGTTNALDACQQIGVRIEKRAN